MKFLVDFHIHSPFSRATSKNMTLNGLYISAITKGIYVLGTGDCIHPEWLNILKENLVESEPGLFKLKSSLIPDIDYIDNTLSMRFLLTTEISTIYKKNKKIRKIHSLICIPDFESAIRLSKRLAKIGNIVSDGRPILGLDTRKLLNICVEINPDIMFIPAHIWTPHFAILGSKSGFDSIEECFEDDVKYIFALETGLSSDPAMNWRLSSLDRFTLVSNSDAHSLDKIAREANIFDLDTPDYYKIKEAIKTKKGFLGTIEFYPEEGKYHLDGHRDCKVCLKPSESRKINNICPVCNKELTIGVLNRVEQLADREEGFRPKNAKPFYSIVPLKEILAEYLNCGVKTKKVDVLYKKFIEKFGPEYYILNELPIEKIFEFMPNVAIGIKNMRNNNVEIKAGYDGIYGIIKVLNKKDSRYKNSQLSLFR